MLILEHCKIKKIDMTEIKNSKEEDLYKILINSNNLVITTHVSPDGDAIGSELALFFFCQQKGITARIINCSETPYNLKFLEGIENVSVYNSSDDDEYIKNSDAIFFLDLNNSNRVKQMEKSVMNSNAIKVVVDHHIDPQDFADHYYIDSKSTSTGELIWKILKFDKDFKYTVGIASALYTAIMTDSGSFRYPNTDEETHLIIAELIRHGADPVRIYEEVYNIIPPRAALLYGEAFAGMEIHYDGKLVVLTISKEIFSKTGASESDIEGLVEQTMTIQNALAGVLITERPNEPEIRISFRSKGDINVRELALSLGGGGHFHAAGARVSNLPLKETKKMVVEKSASLFQLKKSAS
jgi:phosphoesterase RecJ-like protein